ncbi:type VI secretion system accessory protein TagJ [Isosphaeraceae bacterium EP7]
MTARELLEAGRLGEAIAVLGAELKARPTDKGLRVFLFELLCFAGEYDRAGKQLDAIGRLETTQTEVQLGVRQYVDLLAAERSRAAVFAGKARPRFPLLPPEGVALHADALAQLAAGDAAGAGELLKRAEGLHEVVRGSRDGVEFDEVRDADDVLAPVVEVLTAAGYFWVPWSQVQYLEVDPPKRLRDLIWAPAKLATHDGQLGEVFLPALYPGSHTHADESVKLGRATDWQEFEPGSELRRGLGAKLCLVGDEAWTVGELGTLQMARETADTDAGERA